MELPPPLHIGPDAADEVGGRGVAQQVVFRFDVGRQRGLVQVQQRGGQRHRVRGGFLHGLGDLLRRGEVMGLEVQVQKRVDPLEVVLGQLGFKGLFLPGHGGELGIGLQHLLELVGLQKTLRGLVEIPDGLRLLGHGNALLSWCGRK